MNQLVRMLEGRKLTSEDVRAIVDWGLSREEILLPVEQPAQLITAGETLEQAQKLVIEGDRIVGLSTGYDALDKLTRGINQSEIVVVFGDTGHGKSQLCQNITLNVAKAGHPVLFVGLEMNNAENTARFLTMGAEHVERLPILYPLSPDIGYRDIDGLVKAAKAEGCALVVIDHLHMFARDVANLANELSLICHEFKRVARAYEIPIMVVSHINRGKESNRPPELKDLKGSSSIEQDADICLAVYRKDISETEVGEQLTMKIALRKNRKGRQAPSCELIIQPNARLTERKVVINGMPQP